jgi:uncharacterized membrane protein YhaH (DUF805 family)
MEWMLMPFRRYADFNGRSQRKEYWMFVLFMVIVAVVLSFLEGAVGLSGMVLGVYGPLSAIFALAVLIPSLAVGVRRLHDTDRSGWWLLSVYVPYGLVIVGTLMGNLILAGGLGLVALVCAIVLIVFLASDGTHGSNRFGGDPKGQVDPEVFA